jgi:hypothetical protein
LTGGVVKIGENLAPVKADIEDRKITIAIDGPEYTRCEGDETCRVKGGNRLYVLEIHHNKA